MKAKINIEYSEGYLPTKRCRKLRYRNVIENGITINVPSTEISKCKLVFKTFSNGWDDNGDFKPIETDYYKYRGKLYKKVLAKNMCRDGKGTYQADKFLKNIENYGINRIFCMNNEKRTKDFVIKSVKDYIKGYLIIDNNVYQKTGEPRYVINTFGLGHNHGGTGFFIENFYNENINNKNYFNALERDKAIAYYNETTQNRGDTNDVGRDLSDCNIIVYDKSAVKCRPKKQHGQGDLFINSLEDIINSSDSSFEAGLLTIMQTAQSVSK